MEWGGGRMEEVGLVEWGGGILISSMSARES